MGAASLLEAFQHPQATPVPHYRIQNAFVSTHAESNGASRKNLVN
jgi:hypothetical protein